MLAAGLFLWPAAWHVDEPFFLALARQILRDPRHPLSFAFNWYGAAAPMASLNNTPPVFPSLLAAALKLSGGGEFFTRALFFPFDLIAAWSVLALAARFLKKPLWPTLLVLSGPGWALNFPHLMAERVMSAFAFSSLDFAVRSFDEDSSTSFWFSAVLAALALLTKYNAVFLIPVVLVYGFTRRVPSRRLALWAAVALSGLPVGYGLNALFGADAPSAVWTVVSQSSRGVWSAPSHQLRALLAFTGGLALPAVVWVFSLKPSPRSVAAAAVASAVLFAPVFDLAPLVRPVDRVTGAVLAGGVLLTVWSLFRGARTRGSALWSAWLAGVALLQLAYWSVMARFVVFLTPALVFWLWERLEAERPDLLSRLGAATFAATLALTAALGAVDLTYASAQKELAQGVSSVWGRGRKVWFTGHWGLQEYLSEAGARPLDEAQGGWSQAAVGDLVVVPTTNTNILRPHSTLRADFFRVSVVSRVPLRLISARESDAGFYTDVTGFLPWSFSREPLDSFTLVTPR